MIKMLKIIINTIVLVHGLRVSVCGNLAPGLSVCGQAGCHGNRNREE